MMPPAKSLGVRWTIGNVSPYGFDVLRLSILGARRVFGDDAAYLVCVNSVPLHEARARMGELPDCVGWREVSLADVPSALGAHLDTGMAEGVGWKFALPRVLPDCHELSLDNDYVLWAMPEAISSWLAADDACLLSADVRPCFGRFAHVCGDVPLNTGIRGLPPGFDLEARMLAELRAHPDHPIALSSELDEQGLQVATLSRTGVLQVVPLEDVTICSPFWPHQVELGRCGAHFVGLNACTIPWDYYGRPALGVRHEHWFRHRDEVAARVGASTT